MRGAFRLPSACPSPPLQCSREPWLLEVLKPVRRLLTITGCPFCFWTEIRLTAASGARLQSSMSRERGANHYWLLEPWWWRDLHSCTDAMGMSMPVRIPSEGTSSGQNSQKGRMGWARGTGVQVLKDSSIGLTFIIRVFANLRVWTWSTLWNVFPSSLDSHPTPAIFCSL